MGEMERLLQASHETDPEVREKAMGDLGDLGLRDPAIIDRLILALLEDPADEVRAYAAGSLGLLCDPFGAEPLLQALQHDRWWRVRFTSAWALGQMREARAPAALIACTADPDARVRCMVAETLGRFAVPQAVEPLLTMVNDPDPDVQCAALMALNGGWAGVIPLEPVRKLLRFYDGREARDGQGTSITGEAEYLIERVERLAAGED